MLETAVTRSYCLTSYGKVGFGYWEQLEAGRRNEYWRHWQFNDFDAEGLESLVAGMSGNYLLHDVVVVNDGTHRSAQGSTTDPRHPSALLDRLSHYVKLNRAGRRAIPDAAGITPSLRSVVLAKADASYGPSGVFHILRQQPHYISRRT